MGDIEKISGKVELSDPEGWNPKNEQFNLQLNEETRKYGELNNRMDKTLQDRSKILENIVDNQDDINKLSNIENFHNAIHDAYLSWVKDGKPSELDNVKRYGYWPGEESYDFHKDRDKQKTIENKPCHHFRKFPRTQAGKLFFDSIENSFLASGNLLSIIPLRK